MTVMVSTWAMSATFTFEVTAAMSVTKSNKHSKMNDRLNGGKERNREGDRFCQLRKMHETCSMLLKFPNFTLTTVPPYQPLCSSRITRSEMTGDKVRP